MELLGNLALLPFRDGLLVFSSWIAFFLFARFFFSQWLFRDYEVKAWTTQVRMRDDHFGTKGDNSFLFLFLYWLSLGADTVFDLVHVFLQHL